MGISTFTSKEFIFFAGYLADWPCFGLIPWWPPFSVSGCASAAFSIKLSTGPLGARDFNFHGLAHFAGDVGSWIVIGCSEFPIRIDQHEVACFAQKPSYWPIYMVNPNILHHPIMPSWTPGSPQRFLSTWLIQPAAGDFFNPFWSFLVFLSAGFDQLGLWPSESSGSAAGHWQSGG